MAHDARVADGYRAIENLQVGAAQPAVGDAHERFFIACGGHRNPVQRQVAGRPQDHCFHVIGIPFSLICGAAFSFVLLLLGFFVNEEDFMPLVS